MSYYIVLLAAGMMVVIGGLVATDSEGWMFWTQRAIVVLVLACPCSLVISAPIPCICAIAAGARSGVLVKGTFVLVHALRA